MCENFVNRDFARNPTGRCSVIPPVGYLKVLSSENKGGSTMIRYALIGIALVLQRWALLCIFCASSSCIQYKSMFGQYCLKILE
jgi:hypothetical protein